MEISPIEELAKGYNALSDRNSEECEHRDRIHRRLMALGMDIGFECPVAVDGESAHAAWERYLDGLSDYVRKMKRAN